jgi:hypothetical protein
MRCCPKTFNPGLLAEAKPELFTMRRRFPLLAVAVFIIGTWFIGDFIGVFSHPGPIELLAAGAFVLVVGWWLVVTDDRHGLIRKLALVMVSLSITLVLIEVWFVRQVAPISLDRRAELIARNASAKALAVERTPGTFRIMGLADSFGAYGGKKNYHYLVKERLVGQGTMTVEVLNTSIAGTAPGDHLTVYRAFAHYRPDLVLYGFYTGNDFDRPDGVLVQYHGVTWRHYFSWKELRPHHFLVRKWLLRLFEAWRKVGRIARGRVGPRIASAATERGVEHGVFPHDVYLQIERTNFVTNFLRMGNLERKWSHTAQILELLKHEVEANGGRYALVIHPDRVQVDRALRETLYERFDLSQADFDLEQPQRFLLGWCASRGVACLDLLPLFRAHGETGELYLVNGIHYNSAGNELAARAIARWLLAERMVPKMLTGSR